MRNVWKLEEPFTCVNKVNVVWVVLFPETSSDKQDTRSYLMKKPRLNTFIMN